MKDNLKRLIKRWLKRKVTVTLGIMVAFMITGAVSYSSEGVIGETITIAVDEQGNIVVTPEGAGILEGNTWTNNGKIEVVDSIELSETSHEMETKYYLGNGINNKGTIGDINNNGIISTEILVNIPENFYGRESEYYLGNGINNIGIIGNINNNGIISGNGSMKIGEDDSYYPHFLEFKGYLGNGINNKGTIGSINNNGIISGKTSMVASYFVDYWGSEYSFGNGIYNSNSGKIDNINNNGVILGEFTINSNEMYFIFPSGNGIYNEGTIGNIDNSGVISRNNTTYKEGSGINNSDRGIISNIDNNGIIDGIDNDGTIEIIKSSGIIQSNNGIKGWGTIKNIINTGIIMGERDSEESYSGNGIYNDGTIETSLSNKGKITGNSSGKSDLNEDDNLGNGIYSYNKNIQSIENEGIISGNSAEVNKTGNGIYNKDGEIEEIVNKGIISGNSISGTTSGNGIYNNKIIENLKNYGIIAGSNKAIHNENEITITNSSNHGLLIDGAGTENQKITAGANGEQDNKYIINGVITQGENATATAIKSSELKDKIVGGNIGNYYENDSTYYKNLIVNMVGDNNNSLDIDKYLNILNSTINGYKDAIVFGTTNGKFQGENVIINAGENTFVGSNGIDEIYIGNLVALDSVQSIINGNISLGKGNDILTVRAGTLINGNINMGDGTDKIDISSSVLNGDINSTTDIITLDKSSINGNSELINSNINLISTTLNGDIEATGGKISISGTDNLFNVGATVVNGNIILNDGEISIKDGSTINGNITLGGESTTVWLDKNQTLNENITIDENVTNKTLVLNYDINTDDDMSSLKNQSIKFNSIKLSDNGNSNVILTDLNIDSITGGKGVDIFKASIAELSGKIVDGGDGKDTLNLLENITSENQESIDFSKVSNIETLQLADGENNVDISKLNFETIIGGNGDDTFDNVTYETLFRINGAMGKDTINMGSGTTLVNSEINKIFGENRIEKLNLTSDNTVSLNNLDYAKRINFGVGNNTLTLGTQNKGIEFYFTQTGLINGNVAIDLNGNKGVIYSTSNGTTITVSKDFMNGMVTLNNGTIKLNLSQNTDFSKGIDTNLTLDKNGVLGENTTVETYAFLKVNGETITVKDWKELSGDIQVSDTDNIIYDNIVQDFNKDGIYGVLTKWESDSIVNWIKDGGFTLGDYTFENNEKQYSGIVSSGILTVDTSVGGKINDFSINDLSSMDFVIKNNNSDGNGKITFIGETVINGNITNNSSYTTNLVFDGDIEVGNIDNSQSIARTTIDINNKFSSGDIVFNAQENKLNISNSSNINKIGIISGNVDITVENASTDDDSAGFNSILASANKGYVDNNNSITVNNQVNGLEINTNYDGVLTFAGNNNSIIIGNTIGKLVMGNGNDTIVLNTSIFGEDEDNIVVNIDGKEGDDVFSIGSPISTLENDTNSKLYGKILSGTINSFTNININENINFASDLEITGTNSIVVGSGKELGLNVDYSKTEDGKVIGHALYNKGIEVNNDNGKIVVGTSTANKDTVISMGSGNMASTVTNGENIFMSESVNHITTYDKENNIINVTVKKELELGKDEEIKYSHLNEIYKSIFGANKISLMAPSSTLTDKTEDEAIKAQLEFYGKIYNSTPYAYSSDISRETANMVNDSVMDSNFKADEGKWLHYGAISGQGYDDDNSYYGRGYYNSVDLDVTEVDVKSDIYSAYYMGEYGKTDKLALGYVIAGNNSNTDIGESDLKGSGYYLGTYAKYNTRNLRLIVGLGYQHNYYTADRRVSNDYQAMSVEKKYTDDTLIAYSGVKYIHNLSNDISVEPYARLSLTHIMQHSINETNNGDLSILVDGKDFTGIDSEIGVDLVKSTTIKTGKVNLIVGLGADIMLDGYEKEYLTAKINGSNKTFDMVSEEEENFRGKVTLGVEYKKVNGVFYNTKGSYIKTEDNDNYKFEIGIGYKF